MYKAILIHPQGKGICLTPGLRIDLRAKILDKLLNKLKIEYHFCSELVCLNKGLKNIYG